MKAERRHLLLLEIAHLRGVLIESRIDYLKQKYEPLIKTAIDTHKIDGLPGFLNAVRMAINNDTIDAVVSKIFDTIVHIDPDVHKKNTQWLLNTIVSGKSSLEDLDKAKNYLEIYQRVKHMLPVDQRDLNKYKTFVDLYDVIADKERELSKRETDRRLDAEMYKQATIVYDSPTYKILIPLTREASCYFGINTQWCTASANSTNYFDSYNKQGPLYIILDKANNKRWQFHDATGQFTDETDRSVDSFQFTTAHGEVVKALSDYILGTPVATIKHSIVSGELPVFQMKNENLVVMKNGHLFSDKLLTLKIKDNKFVGAKRTGTIFSAKDVADLLNKLKITGDARGGSNEDKFDLYYRNNKWQTIIQAAKPIIRFKDGYYWATVKIDRDDSGNLTNENDLILVPPSTDLIKNDAVKKLGYVCLASIGSAQKGRFFKVEEFVGYPSLKYYDGKSKILNRARNVSVFGSYIVSLLLKTDGIKEWTPTSEFKPADLNKMDATKLINAKPYLGDLQTVYNAKGVCPETRRLVMKKLEEEEVAPVVYSGGRKDYQYKGKWFGKDKDKLIVYEWDSIDDCIDDIGTEDGKAYYKHYIGENSFSNDYNYWPEDVDDYDKRDFINHLANKEPNLLAKVGEYLAKKYPDDVENIEDYDPSEVSKVSELLDATDDDEILNAMKQGMAAGSEGGAQNEASQIFKREVDDNPYLYFVNKNPRKGKWSKNMYQWDGKVIFVVPMGDIVRELSQHDLYDNLSSDGWASVLDDGQLDPKEPYNGFSDYDDNYANERFAEALDEVL